MKRIHVLVGILALAVAALIFKPYISSGLAPLILRLQGKKTVADRLRDYGPAARRRLKPHFAGQGISYPPSQLALVGLKEEKELLVYAADDGGKWSFIRSYPVLAASGNLGPKLVYGDGQVPEGIYRVTFLNANSRYHLSLRLDYPNEFDRSMGKKDGRKNLGTDIMIHGSSISCGCLAMGDKAAEDLFVLAADTGTGNIKVILAPVDFRTNSLPSHRPRTPAWTKGLYKTIRSELNRLPARP